MSKPAQAICYDSLGPLLSQEELACFPIQIPCESKRKADLAADFFEASGLVATVFQNKQGWQLKLDHRARAVL